MKRKSSLDSALWPDNNIYKRSRRAARAPFQQLSEELCFTCLSYLSYRDLLAISETNSYFNRLASDNQLWKSLYMRHFADRQNLATTFTSQSERLPKKTWKELFRIGHNWRYGRATTSQLSLRSFFLPQMPASIELDDIDETQAHTEQMLQNRCSTIPPAKARGCAKVAWHNQFYFVVSRNNEITDIPGVTAYCMTSNSTPSAAVANLQSTKLKGKGAMGSLCITEMQLDDASSCSDQRRLAVFYSSGQFSIFNIRFASNESISYTEEYFSPQPNASPVVLAQLHSPILATVSEDCSIRIRFLERRKPEQGGGPTLDVTSSAPTVRPVHCFGPMTMRLKVTDDHQSQRKDSALRNLELSLAYCTPYYPAGFTVGVQIFNIKLRDSTHRQLGRRPHLDIFARNAIAIPQFDRSDTLGSFAINQGQAIINTLEHDGPYIVASRNDNTISVYHIQDSISHKEMLTISDQSLNSPTNLHGIPLKLKHVRLLFGHTASVDAVSLLDGRCVSTGRDGIKVWEFPKSVDGEVEDPHKELDMDEEWKPNTPVRDAGRATSERDDGSFRSPAIEAQSSDLGICQWIGLDGSRIVTVSKSMDDNFVRVYHFE